jgi:hypothetical protein
MMAMNGWMDMIEMDVAQDGKVAKTIIDMPWISS